jgi:hypothetical protein
MKIKFSNLILVAALCLSMHTSAMTKDDVAKLREEIAGRIVAVTKTYDPSASVDVTLKGEDNVIVSEDKSVQIDNPFILTPKISAKDYKYTFNVQYVEANIFSQYKKAKYPGQILAKIEKILAEYSTNNHITFEEIPVAIEKKNPYDPRNLSLYQIALIVVAVSGVAVLFLHVLSVLFASRRNNNDKILETINVSVETLKNALDGVASSNLTAANLAHGNPETTPMSLEVNVGGESFLKEFEDRSINELLMDCYWSAEDEYAAFIWSKLDVVRKGRLVDMNERLTEYANYITSLKGEDRNYISQPYYLNPFDLHSITNESLSKMVTTYGALFHVLPNMRVAALKIDAASKKKLMQQKFSKYDTEFELASIKWDRFQTTETRQFEITRTFKFETDEEELDFFEDPKLDFSLVGAFPSLGWLTYFKQDDINDVLSPFSAKELSIAWCGPEMFLQKLEDSLPEKKRELLRSYLEKTVPTRDNAVFREIQRRSIHKYQELQTFKTIYNEPTAA